MTEEFSPEEMERLKRLRERQSELEPGDLIDPPDPDHNKNDAVALELRKAGATFKQIGDRFQVSGAVAKRMVQRALKRDEGMSIEETRKLDAHRLDALFFGLWQSALNGDLPAVDRCLKIIEMRAKLLGTHQPAQPNFRTTVVDEAVRLAEQLDMDPKEVIATVDAILSEERG